MREKPIKVMSIMAHQDDFEFNAGGLFSLLRRKYKNRLQIRLVASSKGSSGHHQMNPEDVFRRRAAEQGESAALLGAGYECLTGLDGEHLSGQVFPDRNTVGGIWNAIRRFEPDYIFCPPVISDPLAGIHIDHYNTACAVRLAAYQVIVPNAYPTLGAAVNRKRVAMPLILNVDDPYANPDQCHVVREIASVYEQKVRMALCHESQILEWLPWTRGSKPLTRKEFIREFRTRHTVVNARYGRDDRSPREYFTFTRWGRSPEPRDADLLFADAEVTAAGGSYIGRKA
jgi:LmbE family N-acetylglucosaminyl deacetylase